MQHLDKCKTFVCDWTGGLLEIRKPIKKKLWVFLASIPVFGLLAVWWFLTDGKSVESRIISPVILPSPVEVVLSFKTLWFEAGLMRAILATLGRVTAGFLIAVAFALPIGILGGSFTRARALISPVLTFGGYIPIPTLIPLTMSFFGTGELQKIMFLAIAFFNYMLPLIVEAIDQVDTVFIQTIQTLGANTFQTVRYTMVGVSGLGIFRAMRMCYGIGLSYIILAEMVAAQFGLGAIIIIAQRRGPKEHIYLVLVVIVALAWLIDRAWGIVESRLFPYKAAQ